MSRSDAASSADPGGTRVNAGEQRVLSATKPQPTNHAGSRVSDKGRERLGGTTHVQETCSMKARVAVGSDDRELGSTIQKGLAAWCSTTPMNGSDWRETTSGSLRSRNDQGFCAAGLIC